MTLKEAYETCKIGAVIYQEGDEYYTGFFYSNYPDKVIADCYRDKQGNKAFLTKNGKVVAYEQK